MALIQITKGDTVYLTDENTALFAHCTGASLIKEDELDKYVAILEAHGIDTAISRNSIEVVSVETKTEVEYLGEIETIADGEPEDE